MAEAPEHRDEKGQDRSGSAFVAEWLDAIELASRTEKDWRKDAEEAVGIYKAGEKGQDRFNILHSNTETVVPAIYNSVPIPDVRRRYGDKDEAGRQVSEIIERALSYEIDAYDFDGLMASAAQAMALVGRGVARVEYDPTIEGEGEYERVASEHVRCRLIPWADYRQGPAKCWEETPWVAFRSYLSRSKLRKLNSRVASKVQLDASVCQTENDDPEKPAPDLYGRAEVWEVWDREAKKVHFIAKGYGDGPLKSVDDPLELEGFFPCPEPMQAIRIPDSTVPVVPYRSYEKLAEELNLVTKRITKIVQQVKVCGIYAAIGDDLKTLESAGDGELVPATGTEIFAGQGNGLDKAIAWWPIEPAVKALAQLYAQREQIKQTIYEVTGIADILRGQTKASETLGAQQIKAQWGSLRIQQMQKEVARFARDLFRLKAEIMASKFSWETLSVMTGVKLPTEQEQALVKAQIQQVMAQAQATGQKPPEPPAEMKKMLESPTREEVEGLLRNETIRQFRIDIESDSTIRADLTRAQEQMNMFLQASAQFGQGAATMAAQFGPAIMEPLTQIYVAFCRNFRLGKQAEDALEGLTETAANAAKMAGQPKPDPKAEADKAKAQADIEKTKIGVQAAQAKAATDVQAKQAEMALKERELQLREAELDMKARELEMTERASVAKHQRDMEKIAVSAVTQQENRGAAQ